MSLYKRFSIIMAIFSIGIIIFSVISYYSIEKVRVNGPIYKQIIQGKDLIADILPPPEYLVESYLVAFQLINEENKTEVNELLARSKKLKEEYYTRHQFWINDLSDSEIKKLLISDSFKPADDFWKIFENKFLTQLSDNDKVAALQTLNNDLKLKYAEHRKVIDRIVDLQTKENAKIEFEANKEISNKIFLMMGIGLFSLIISFVFTSTMAIKIVRKIRGLVIVGNHLSNGNVEDAERVFITIK